MSDGSSKAQMTPRAAEHQSSGQQSVTESGRSAKKQNANGRNARQPEPTGGSVATADRVAVATAGVGHAPVSSGSEPKSQATTASEAAAVHASVPTIRRLTLTHGVEGREPLPAVGIQAERPVFAFFEAANPDSKPQIVQVTFEHLATGRRVGFVELEIPAESSRWRTWATTERIQRAGSWRVIVEDARGKVLVEKDFAVIPNPSGGELALHPG